jgi:anti-sigma factor RsiW
MADPRQLALIHAEIDGELDSSGRAELARWVLADPEVRVLRAELRRVCAVLDSLPAVEPPEELRPSILAALPQTYGERRRSWTPGWRYVALIAGVAVAGAVVLQTVRGPRPAPSEVAGTMSALPAAALDTVQLPNGPVSGRVSLYRESSGLGVRFDLVTSSPVDVLVTGAGHTLRVKGLGGRPTAVELRGFPTDVPTVDVAFLMEGRPAGTATLHTAVVH